MPAARPLKVRSINSYDVADPHLDDASVADLMQILIGHGDTDFVESVKDTLKHRARWLYERDADERRRAR